MSSQPASARHVMAAVLSLTLLAGCADGLGAPVEPAAASPALDVTILADQRLADADAAVEKAIALLQAAENPSAPKPDRPFGGHDVKALRHLEAARVEIARAQAYADASTGSQ